LLEQKLAILNRFQKLTIAIDGHCDERGNDEFNLTLGRRRAVSVKQFFTDRGVNPERITTASFGRERPLVEGATEEAWARNRRAEFRIIDGDSM
jgi:peptidoglycan-associated lipoprotein